MSTISKLISAGGQAALNALAAFAVGAFVVAARPMTPLDIDLLHAKPGNSASAYSIMNAFYDQVAVQEERVSSQTAGIASTYTVESKPPSACHNRGKPSIDEIMLRPAIIRMFLQWREEQELLKEFKALAALADIYPVDVLFARYRGKSAVEEMLADDDNDMAEARLLRQEQNGEKERNEVGRSLP